MKKIIAAAVTAAFVAPAFAADVNITGDMEYSLKDANSVSTSALDGDFNIKVSGDNGAGISYAADFNVNAADTIANDGGNSLTLSGEFGTVDMGDTSSAVDAIDDITDPSYVLGQGTGGGDADILWTLPLGVEGLTVYASYGADTMVDSSEDTHTGVAFTYSAGGFTLGMGLQDNDDSTEHSIVNGSYSTGGLTISAEVFTDKSVANVDTDTKNVGVSYDMGNMLVFVEGSELKTSGSTATSDYTTVGIQAPLGSGLTVFLEQTDDSISSANEATVAGIALTF
jgi:outer membrane protein OmpU